MLAQTSERGTGLHRPYVEGDHRRKGFNRDPDWRESRKPAEPKPEAEFSAYHKTHVMERAVSEKPPRAKPGETAKVFTGECRPSEYKGGGIDPGDGSLVQKVYCRSKNAEWKRPSEVAQDFKPENDILNDFRQAMKADLERVAAKRQAEKEQQLAERELVKAYPFAYGKDPVGRKQDLKKYYGIEVKSEPLEALHPEQKRDMTKIPGFETKHEAEPKRKADIDTNQVGLARYEGRSSMKVSRRRKQAEEAETLRSQLEETKALKRAALAAEERDKREDRGLVGKLAPSKQEKESYGMQSLITAPAKPTIDPTLAQDLKSQMSAELQRKERDKHPARYDKFEKFDPYVHLPLMPPLLAHRRPLLDVCRLAPSSN